MLDSQILSSKPGLGKSSYTLIYTKVQMTDTPESFVSLRKLNFKHEEISLYSGKCSYVNVGKMFSYTTSLHYCPTVCFYMLKIEPHVLRLWTFGCFQSRTSMPHGLIFSPHRNLLPLLYVLLRFNDTKRLPFSQAANY